MAKQHEIEYARRMNADHAVNKPFSDADCGRNLIRIGTIMTLLPPAPSRILDMGCGTGWTSLFFARAGYEVVGVDIAPEMIRLANEQRDAANLPHLSFTVSDYESLAFHDEFDVVVFFDSLHHADNERLAISRAFDALKPGGVCIAEEPGAGHATSPDSLAAVAEFGVTEKDMPPAHVVGLGQEIGFTSFLVFPRPEDLHREVYWHRADPKSNPFAEIEGARELQPHRSLWERLRDRIGLTLDPYTPPAWRITNVDHLLLHLRSQGLVLMQKDDEPPARAAA